MIKRGDTIPLNGDRPPLLPCQWCDHAVGRVIPGSGPHYAGVRCNGCGRHLGWLSQERMGELPTDVRTIGTRFINAGDDQVRLPVRLLNETDEEKSGEEPPW